MSPTSSDVRGPCDNCGDPAEMSVPGASVEAMTDDTAPGPMVLTRTNLRYVLTMNLAVHGPMTIKELTAMLDEQGFTTAGPPAKRISDALRTERARGRVWRRGRGLYGPGSMPRSTEWRIHRRWIELRERAKELTNPAARQPACGQGPHSPHRR